jgi:chemotaxis response regulator CheB
VEGGPQPVRALAADAHVPQHGPLVLVEHRLDHARRVAGAADPILEAEDGVAVRENCVFVIPPEAFKAKRAHVEQEFNDLAEKRCRWGAYDPRKFYGV